MDKCLTKLSKISNAVSAILFPLLSKSGLTSVSSIQQTLFVVINSSNRSFISPDEKPTGTGVPVP